MDAGRARLFGRAAGVAASAVVVAGAAHLLQSRAEAGPRVRLTGAALPEWVLPTDLLSSVDQAHEHTRLADDLGLPMVLDELDAWAALGVLAAAVRLVDTGSRTSLVVDLGAPRSAVSRWCRAVGFPVARELPAEAGGADLVVRVHPARVRADDVDDLLERASAVLRPGGAVVTTVPVGDDGADGALGRADLRALVARAHDLGLVLVGDLDGELGHRLAHLARVARDGGPDADGPYALLRLTFRRR
ncbi:hypothetical protein [Arsenicicoccus dermatophilus]|uniref:hypothetical protein n=1 Tax=Arsenicicoccus dermatophilus TaxID=1076331 RepID=UPI001F4C70D1|nr:hypothetical protein [Arsenicicoccus dermatophilus]MCH8612316.1 hypothetical protein [Arsenicicoccus dermatophilus]